MGNGPTFQLKIGEHYVKVFKENCYPVRDTIKVDPNHTFFIYNLALKPEMVLIKSGTFRMGRTEGGDEEPVHEVKLNDFFMGNTEVTFAEYDVFCEAMGRQKTGDSVLDREKRAVIYVNWYDAVEYCNWLSEQEGLVKCYSINKNKKDPFNQNEYDNLKWLVTCDFRADGYRLPTEAEWEYAAWGGSQNAQNTVKGNNMGDNIAWRFFSSRDKIHPVGRDKPNELGIYDMNGNVWEWCWDWYGRDYYAKSPRNNPLGPGFGSYRVIRGCWSYFARVIGSGGRVNGAYETSDDSGFRLCRTGG